MEQVAEKCGGCPILEDFLGEPESDQLVLAIGVSVYCRNWTRYHERSLPTQTILLFRRIQKKILFFLISGSVTYGNELILCLCRKTNITAFWPVALT